MADLETLPDELLLNVALRSDVRGILSLASTSRRVRPVSQEALFCTASVPLMDLWKLASALLRRPDLAKLFTRLDIVGMWKDVYESSEAGRAYFSEIIARPRWSACFDLLLATYPCANKLRTVAEMKTPEGFIFAAFAMVVAHTPALKTLRMTTETLEYIQSGCVLANAMNSSSAAPEYHGRVRFLLQCRLNAIEIIGDHSHLDKQHWQSVHCPTSLHSDYFEVGGYIWLRRLVIPHRIFTTHRDRIFGRRDTRLLCALDGLPASLEYLRVEWTDNPPLLRLAGLEEILRSPSRLQQLELRFRTNLLSTAWDACRVPMLAKRTLDILRRWNGRSAFVLATTFGNGKHTDVGQGIEREPPANYESGSLTSAIEGCLVTTTDQLALQADLMDALGYTPP